MQKSIIQPLPNRKQLKIKQIKINYTFNHPNDNLVLWILYRGLFMP